MNQLFRYIIGFCVAMPGVFGWALRAAGIPEKDASLIASQGYLKAQEGVVRPGGNG